MGNAPPAADSSRIVPLDDETGPALQTLLDALTGVDPTLALTAASMEVPLDLLLGSFPETEPLARELTEMARLFVHHAVGSDRAPERDRMNAAADHLRKVAAELGSEREPFAQPLSEPQREALRADALVDLGTLLREVGLEELDVDFYLANQQADGATVLVWHPLPPETAHVWLLSRLYPRIEVAVALDPLLALERRASRWWFERWSSRATQSDQGFFDWSVREQEYSFVERVTLALDAPIVFAVPQEHYSRIPPRQKDLVMALEESVPGVFRVREHGGARVVLEDATDGTRYEVHEHNPEIPYDAGLLGCGRLLPLGDGRWLRSPGMAFLRDAGITDELIEAIEVTGENLGFGPALESFLTLVRTREKLPRHVVPAESPAEARELLLLMNTTLRLTGLARRIDDGEIPDELREAVDGSPDSFVLDVEVDEAVAGWLDALTRQAGRPRRGEATGRKKRKRKGR